MKADLALCSIAFGKCQAVLLAAFFLAACTTMLRAERFAPTLKKFISADGAVEFRYSEDLVHCERQGANEGYSWLPVENCAAYFPLCDSSISQNQTSIACFAYPRNRFTDTRAFEGATFSVEIIDAATRQNDCLSMSAEEGFIGQRGTRTIHGVSFTTAELSDAGMSQRIHGHVYRTFHGGKCYQLGINVVTADSQTFDPPVRDLSKSDWREIYGPLEQARDSFRFLK